MPKATLNTMSRILSIQSIRETDAHADMNFLIAVANYARDAGTMPRFRNKFKKTQLGQLPIKIESLKHKVAAMG